MNVTSNMTAQDAAMVQAFIQEVYETNVFGLALISSVALVAYAALLNIGREIEYIWSKRFSLPSFLYIFARYGDLIGAGLNVVVQFISLPGGVCNGFADASNVMNYFTTLGVQGLLIARAYSLCRGNKIIGGILALSLFSELVIQLFEIIVFNGCIPTANKELILVGLLSNIFTLITDFLVFGVCLWSIWGTWRLKREAGIQSSNDLVSIILAQIFSRLFFVITVTITSVILHQAGFNSPVFGILINFQNSLSPILIAGFTLDLRQRNSQVIEASNITLPTLQIQTVLQQMNQSILVELGDHNDRDIILEAGNNGDHADVETESLDDANDSETIRTRADSEMTTV